jgi:hypothetical protein
MLEVALYSVAFIWGGSLIVGFVWLVWMRLAARVRLSRREILAE